MELPFLCSVYLVPSLFYLGVTFTISSFPDKLLSIVGCSHICHEYWMEWLYSGWDVWLSGPWVLGHGVRLLDQPASAKLSVDVYRSETKCAMHEWMRVSYAYLPLYWVTVHTFSNVLTIFILGLCQWQPCARLFFFLEYSIIDLCPQIASSLSIRESAKQWCHPCKISGRLTKKDIHASETIIGFSYWKVWQFLKHE